MSEVAEISQKQAEDLKGKTFAPDSYFHPIQDADGKWIVSKEEIVQCKDDRVDAVFIKQLPLRTHKEKRTEIDSIEISKEIKPK